jgi:hypothetical protein
MGSDLGGREGAALANRKSGGGSAMLTVKEAVDAAEKWVRNLYPASALKQLRLEEVELSSDERIWRVTLGWAEPGVPENGLAAALGRNVPRVYKRVEVDAETGTVRAMRIREVGIDT